MPKHIPKDQYSANPYEIVPNGYIHPDIEHHDHAEEEAHYLLPAVFSSDKGLSVKGKYPGPGVYYITDGELHFEDSANPGSVTVVKAGSVVHIEEGAVIHWKVGPGVKGFAVFNVPVSVKSFDEFVVPE
ncbi:hypothetical protein JR316_0011246 [Psilocybe cubensis]|uniref:Uncharacterized protein n=2 Tax=Psilocybe cubensis TaxID=181762 RepID=A0A8H7XSB8_PSICU|nr:hypothetical protein JR316_0011246 [Psilocybe cubensis]KAH9475687.1 hypothetical protein JR316_0011246 [Psilocybe cubensis]